MRAATRQLSRAWRLVCAGQEARATWLAEANQLRVNRGMKSGQVIGLLVLAAAGAWGYQAQLAAGSIEGQVLNAVTGAPLRKATVQLMEISRREPTMSAGGDVMQAPSWWTVEVDDEGRFSFNGLEAGSYSLMVQRTRFLRQSYGERLRSSGGKPISVSTGQHVKDILFKLSPQSVIAGKVVDEDGEGMANVQVWVLQRRYLSGKMRWVQGVSARTSDLGEYRIAALAPGKYLVGTSPMRMNNVMGNSSNKPFPVKPESTYADTYYPSSPDLANAAPVELPAGGEVRGVDIRERKAASYWVRGRVEGMTDECSGNRNFHRNDQRCAGLPSGLPV